MRTDLIERALEAANTSMTQCNPVKPLLRELAAALASVAVRTVHVADMSYGPDDVLVLRKEVIKYRDEALKQDDFAKTVCLSHVIALLHAFAQELDSNGLFKTIEELRLEWLKDNDPCDGTDVVTPFDQYLYRGGTKP